MTIDSLRDVTHVMDNLSPEQSQTLDQWSDQLQSVLRTAVEQGGPAAQRAKNWLNGVWLGHPGNLGGSDSWEDAGSWPHRRSTRMSCANAR